MPKYTTQYVMNLSTGKPFVFEVPKEKLDRLDWQRRLLQSGHGSPLLGRDIKTLTETHEFYFFPAFEVLLNIGTGNGFTIDLILQILRDFGIAESFIVKLLENETFMSDVVPWFEGISHDGGRASKTLRVIYDLTKSHFSPTEESEWKFFTDSR